MVDDTPIYNLNQGIEGIAFTNDKAHQRLVSTTSIQRSASKTRDKFDEAIVKGFNIEQKIIEELKPAENHEAIMSPSKYESSLSSAAEILHDLGQEYDEQGFIHCAEFIQNELTTLKYLNRLRNQAGAG